MSVAAIVSQLDVDSPLHQMKRGVLASGLAPAD